MGSEEYIKNIRKIINDKGLKHKYVAEKAGLKPQDFSNMLNNRKEFKTAYVVPVCNALGITPNDFFGITS